MWQNSKKQIVSKLKNSDCDKTQKLKLWQNFKKNNMWHKPKKIATEVIVTVVTITVVTVEIVKSFSKKQLYTSTTDEMFSGQLFAFLAMFFLFSYEVLDLSYIKHKINHPYCVRNTCNTWNRVDWRLWSHCVILKHQH